MRIYLKLKGIKLFKQGKVRVDLKTKQRIHFSVNSNEPHYVTFDIKEKKWSCDCKFWSLKQTECSHIIACKLFLNKQRI